MRLKNVDKPPTDNIALRLIRFLAADEERLGHLVGATGLAERDFLDRAQDPQFQAFVMDYALENESLLLEFAASENLRPEAVVSARRRLPGAMF